MKVAYIFWTTNTLTEAKQIVHTLLEEKLIACANIIPTIHSLYVWNGELKEDHEVKVILKSKTTHFKEVERVILNKCSYEVPEISMVEIDQIHEPYKVWLEKSVKE